MGGSIENIMPWFFAVNIVSALICIALATIKKGADSGFGWGFAGFFLGILGLILCIFVLYFWPQVDYRKKRFYQNLLEGMAYSAVGLILFIIGNFFMREEINNPGSFGTGVYGFIPIPGIVIILLLI